MSQTNLQLPQLERQPMEPRALKSIVLSTITIVCAVTACIPLFSVLIMLLYRGGKRLTFELFYTLPPGAFDAPGIGGFGNAILGTAFMVGIAGLISIPFGILAAVYLAEMDPYSKVSEIARFCAKTMTGLPSIIAGVFCLRHRCPDHGSLLVMGRRHCLVPADDPHGHAHGRRGH